MICLLPLAGVTQDLIYKKDHSIEYARIQEIGMGVISYKRWYLTDNALMSAPEEDVVKVRYQDGREVIYTDSEQLPANDSLDYSMIYIVYESGMDESQSFPCFLNGMAVCKLRNHSRIKLKVYSEGIIEISRIAKGVSGPGVFFDVTHGNFYGIAIHVPNTQKLAPTDRFKLSTYSGKAGFSRFLDTEFNSFKPFKQDDMTWEEDRSSPVIQ